MDSEKSLYVPLQSPDEQASEFDVLQALEKAGMVRSLDVDKTEFKRLISANEQLLAGIAPEPNPIPENQVMEQVKEYRVDSEIEPDLKTALKTNIEPQSEPKSDPDAAYHSSAKHYRLYFNVNLPHSYQHITVQWNQKEMAKMEMVSHPTDWLHRFTPLLSRSETEVALMLRFVKQRTMFFEQHAMLSADDVLEVLGLAKKNARRTVRELVTKHQLILFKYENKLQAPAFQFNGKGQVYPALLAALPQVHEMGIDSLELALWLVNDFPALLVVEQPVAEQPSANSGNLPPEPFSVESQTFEALSFESISFESALQRANTAIQNSHFYQTKPIELLAQQKDSVFELMLQRWLNTNEGINENVNGKNDEFSLHSAPIGQQ